MKLVRDLRLVEVEWPDYPALLPGAADAVAWLLGKRKRIRKPKPNLATAIKQATKAGVKVNGATIAADGSISLTLGNNSTPPDDEINEWDAIQ